MPRCWMLLLLLLQKPLWYRHLLLTGLPPPSRCILEG
jgi:hypothetical protein